MQFVIIYFFGFIFTLIFLKLFGRKLGFDYDPPHPSYYDDYKTTNEAFVTFSAFWFGFIPMGLIIGSILIIKKIGHYILEI